MRAPVCFVCCALIGCGEVIATSGPDAEPNVPDAEVVPDALIPDADLTAQASVTIRSRINGTGAVGTALAGIPIISLRPDGSVASTAMSDASGLATFDIWPGGSVTAIYSHPTDAGHDFVTYLGVQSDDELELGILYNTYTGSTIATLTASWPSGVPAQYYSYGTTSFNSAGALAPTTSASLTFGDYVPSPVDIFYNTYNSSGVNLRWGYLENVTVPGGSAGLGFWNSYINAPLAVSGLPAEVTYTDLSLHLICNGQYSCQSASVGGNPTGGAYTGMVERAQSGDRAFGQLYLQRDGNFQQQRLFEAMSSNASQWTVTNPVALPWVGGTFANGAARLGQFLLVGEGSYDGLGLRFTWSHYDPIMGVSYGSRWNVYGPPVPEGLTTFRLPDLGDDFEDILPAPQDGMSLSVQLIDIGTVDGFDELRELPESQVQQIENAVRQGVFTRAQISGGTL